MDRYQLAKLVEWAGRLKSRKRMQKVVYLLQCAGAPLDADYQLHNYGPYSFDVANLSNELTQVGVLKEDSSPHSAGQQYNYELLPHIPQMLADFEKTDEGVKALQLLAPYESIAKHLVNTSLSELEYAATMAYFFKRGADWPEAIERTCKFKKISPDSTDATNALDLAKSVVK